MKSMADALELRNHVIEKLEHADVTEMAEVKGQLLTFAVVGAGFSGVETAGEIKDLVDRSLQYYPNIDPAEVRVVVLEFGDRILPELPESLASYAQMKLTKRGIEVLLNTGVTEATATQIVTSDGQLLGTRTVIATVGNAATEVVQEMNLPQKRGRIYVERTLQVAGHQNIWALGDAALVPMQEGATEDGDFAPPTAQFAVREARLVARNIETVLQGGTPSPFLYRSKGALASLGSSRGVAEVFGIRITGFAAWILWRSYYLSFAPGFGTKLRIAVNWLLDSLINRSTVQIKTRRRAAARYVRYRAGDKVFEHGNRADGLYSVLEGSFELIIKTPDGSVATQRTFRRGEHFGERVLLGEGLRTGSVRAVEDSRALMLDSDDFQKLTRGMSAFRMIFAKELGLGEEPSPRSAGEAGDV